MQFLGTVNGLPSLQLGTYLKAVLQRLRPTPDDPRQPAREDSIPERLSESGLSRAEPTRRHDLPYWGIATADPTTPLSDDDAMELALAEARLAADEGEVPVGAVTLIDGRVVAARHNEREGQADPTAHAEILALRDAAAAVGGWRLSE